MLYPYSFLLLKVLQVNLALFQEFVTFTKIFPQIVILESQIVYLLLHLVMLRLGKVTFSIALQNIAPSLQLVIFLVQKVYLILQFGHVLFVLLIHVFYVNFFEVLCWHIELM